MKNNLIRTVAFVVMLGLIASLFSGCFLKEKPVDGPGMVNYNGILMDALRGEWISEDESYRAVIIDDYTISIYYCDTVILQDAQLTLYADSEDTDAYNEFTISPNVLGDEKQGELAVISKAYSQNGQITLEFDISTGQ